MKLYNTNEIYTIQMRNYTIQMRNYTIQIRNYTIQMKIIQYK